MSNKKRHSGRPYRMLLRPLLAASAIVLTVACDRTAPLSASSRSIDSDTLASPNFAQFNDVPVPSGAEMDIQRSLVLGDREAWIGRLVIAVGLNPGKAYDFYFDEMPRFGWQPITSVRSETSVLTYTRGSRVATIQIQPRSFAGATVSMTVSPKGGSGQPYAAGERRDDLVTTAPLR